LEKLRDFLKELEMFLEVGWEKRRKERKQKFRIYLV